MPITLKEALQVLTVADLKDLVSHVPSAQAVGRKDDLIAQIAQAMMGDAVKLMWSQLDALQSAAVAEAVHHPLGEYSAQRFRVK